MSKFNYFERISVATTNFEDHEASWNFVSSAMLLLNESIVAANVIEYSFDGTTVHGDLRPTLASQGVAKDSFHESKVYFRLAAGASDVIVRIETWA